MANKFLKKIEEALATGKPNESTEKINLIDDQSKTMSASDAEKKIEKRIDENGYITHNPDSTEIAKIQKEYDDKMSIINSEDEKNALIAEIRNAHLDVELNGINFENKIKKLKEFNDNQLAHDIINFDKLKAEFIKKYGKEEFKKTFKEENT